MDFISVNDKPAPLDDCLVYTKKHGFQKVWWNNDSDRYAVGGWESCCYCGGISDIEYEDVTHWMPLPKAPHE